MVERLRTDRLIGMAQVEAVGIVIEKSFQNGRQFLETAGYRVLSLARIAGFEKGQVVEKEFTFGFTPEDAAFVETVDN